MYDMIEWHQLLCIRLCIRDKKAIRYIYYSSQKKGQSHMKSEVRMSEAGIKGRDKKLHLYSIYGM